MAVEQAAPGTPLWVRLWHWAIAVLFVALVYTGAVLSFSGSGFAVMDYALASSLHDWTGIALAGLYGVFLVIALATGYWRSYLRRYRRCRERLVRHPGSPAPTTHWNRASAVRMPRARTRVDAMRPRLLLCQQLLYLASVSMLLPVLIVTGLFYLYPQSAPEEVLGFAGLWPMAQAHYLAGLLGTLFLIFHAYIGTIGGLTRIIFGR